MDTKTLEYMVVSTGKKSADPPLSEQSLLNYKELDLSDIPKDDHQLPESQKLKDHFTSMHSRIESKEEEGDVFHEKADNLFTFEGSLIVMDNRVETQPATKQPLRELSDMIFKYSCSRRKKPKTNKFATEKPAQQLLKTSPPKGVRPMSSRPDKPPSRQGSQGRINLNYNRLHQRKKSTLLPSEMLYAIDEYSRREEYQILHGEPQQSPFKSSNLINMQKDARSTESNGFFITESLSGNKSGQNSTQVSAPKFLQRRTNGIAESLPSSPSRNRTAHFSNSKPSGAISQRGLASSTLEILKENAKLELATHEKNLSKIRKRNIEKYKFENELLNQHVRPTYHIVPNKQSLQFQELHGQESSPTFSKATPDRIKPEADPSRPGSPRKVRSGQGSRPISALPSRSNSRKKSLGSESVETGFLSRPLTVTPTPVKGNQDVHWDISAMRRTQPNSRISSRRNSGPKASMLLLPGMKRAQTPMQTERSTPIHKARALLSYRSVTPSGLTPRRSEAEFEDKTKEASPFAIA